MVVEDLPLFEWSHLKDKGEIGRGFVAKYAPASRQDSNVNDESGEKNLNVVIKKLLGTENEEKRVVFFSKKREGAECLTLTLISLTFIHVLNSIVTMFKMH